VFNIAANSEGVYLVAKDSDADFTISKHWHDHSLKWSKSFSLGSVQPHSMSLSDDGKSLVMLGRKHSTGKSLVIWIDTLNGAANFKSVSTEISLYDVVFAGDSLITCGSYNNEAFMMSLTKEMAVIKSLYYLTEFDMTLNVPYANLYEIRQIIMFDDLFGLALMAPSSIN